MSKSIIIASFIALFALNACQPSSSQPESSPVTNQTQVLKAASNSDFATTSTRLKAAIESRGLTLFATVDHAAGAAKVDKELAPNTLYIFGNPNAGTPFMQSNPAFGIDLPLKAHVYEDAGKIYVAVSNIRGLADAASINDREPVINKVSETLSAIQREATGG